MNFNLRLKDDIATFTKQLFYALFDTEEQQKEELKSLKVIFLNVVSQISVENGEAFWNAFLEKLPEIKRKIELDALATEKNDPACKSLEEIYLAYPGFHAIAIYRLSHELFKLNLPVVSRMMSEYIHGITGIDIHPGATIGKSFFIDHGTGVVIGETTSIGDNVKVYQGVTLGALQVLKEEAGIKRHPTIEDNVIIYSGATILGGNTVIGHDTVIGGNVWLTENVPSFSLVFAQNQIKLRSSKKYIQAIDFVI